MASIKQAVAFWICLSLPFLFLSPAQIVVAADITVDAECSLADAIRAVESDDAVGGCPAGHGADTIILTDDVALEWHLPDIESTLAIEGNGYSIRGSGRHRIFSVSEQGALTLRNVTLLGGNRDSGGAVWNAGLLIINSSAFRDNEAYKNNGGAIYNVGQLDITDSVFENNRADRQGDTTSSGGAIYNGESDGANGEVMVSNSTFRGNWAEWTGGAISNEAGVVTINNTSFDGNSSDFSGGALDNEDKMRVSDSSFAANSSEWAGAIFNLGQLAVTSSQFTRNLAEDFGGAILNSGEANVSESGFSENSAGGFGGAINNRNAQLKVSGGKFSGNSAEWGGAISSSDDVMSEKAELSILDSAFVSNTADYGGAIIGDGVQEIAGSSFIGNSAALLGGAIMNSGRQLSITDSTFSANTAEYDGGALSLSNSAQTVLAHLTVVGNAAGKGGGVYVHHLDGDKPLAAMHNSLLAENEGGDCSAVFAENSANLIADGSCEPSLSGDPLLGTLALAEDGWLEYFLLLPGSPAIDAADPDHCTATDQLGTPRPQGAACDIGAVEYRRE